MADYRELLRRAMETLPENNGAARRQVYEKARAALVAQLRAIDPPLAAREITQHRLQLEDCIREVEQEATDRLLGGLKSREEPETTAAAEDDTVFEQVAEVVSETVAVAGAAPEVEPEEEAAETADPEVEPEVEEETKTEPEIEAIAADEDEADGGDANVTADDLAAALAEAEDALAVSGPEPDALEEDSSSADAIAAVLEEYEEISAEVDNLVADTDADADAQPDDTGKSDDGETDNEPTYRFPFSVIEEITDDEDEAAESERPWAASEDRFPEDSQGFSDTAPRPGTIEFIIAQAQAAAEEAAVPTRWRNDAIASGMVSADVLEKDRPAAEEPKPAYTNGAAATAHSLDINPVPDDEAAPAPDEAAMSKVREVDVEAGGNDPQFVVDKAIEALDREARGESSGVSAEDASAAAEAVLSGAKPLAGSAEDERGGGNALTIFLVLFLVLLAGVGGAGYWAWREGYIDLDAMFDVADTSQPAAEIADSGTPVPAPELDEVPEGPGNTAAVDSTADVPIETAVNEDRLPASEPDEAQPAENAASDTPATETPAADTAAAATDTAIAEPDIDAAKTEERLPTGDAGTQADTTADTEAAAAQTEQVIAPIGAQSLLLEASSEGTTGAVPFSGTVDWTRGVDELGLPTLMASAKIPARNLGVDVLIRLNSDPALPASHIMEINFDVSDTFPGGSIANLPGVLLKNEELAQGTLLAGASARVVGNSFLFALSAAEQDRASNISLLGRKWLDLALIYGSGKHAIITLEKDNDAQTMFTEVMDVWAKSVAEQQAASTGSG